MKSTFHLLQTKAGGERENEKGVIPISERDQHLCDAELHAASTWRALAHLGTVAAGKARAPSEYLEGTFCFGVPRRCIRIYKEQ